MSGIALPFVLCALALVPAGQFVLRSEGKESNCAVVALTVCLRLWGHDVSCAAVAKELGLSDGSRGSADAVSLADLERAARRWEPNVEARKAGLATLARVPLPAVAHGVITADGQPERLTGGHYVVLLRLDAEQAVVADPLTMQVATVPRSRFAAFYDGYVLARERRGARWAILFVCFTTLAAVLLRLARRLGIRETISIVLASGLALGTTAGCSREPTPFSPAEEGESPLEALPAQLDLGTVSIGETVTRSVRLRNVSSKRLRLKLVDPGCASCTAELVQTELSPGETTELRVSVASDRAPAGPFYRTIGVATREGKAVLTIEVSALVEGLKTEPYTFRCGSNAETPPPLKGKLILAERLASDSVSLPEVELEDLLAKQTSTFKPCMAVGGEATWGPWQKVRLPMPCYEREFTVPLVWVKDAACVPRQVLAHVECTVRGQRIRHQTLLRIVPAVTVTARPADR